MAGEYTEQNIAKLLVRPDQSDPQTSLLRLESMFPELPHYAYITRLDLNSMTSEAAVEARRIIEHVMKSRIQTMPTPPDMIYGVNGVGSLLGRAVADASNLSFEQIHKEVDDEGVHFAVRESASIANRVVVIDGDLAEADEYTKTLRHLTDRGIQIPMLLSVIGPRVDDQYRDQGIENTINLVALKNLTMNTQSYRELERAATEDAVVRYRQQQAEIHERMSKYYEYAG